MTLCPFFHIRDNEKGCPAFETPFILFILFEIDLTLSSLFKIPQKTAMRHGLNRERLQLSCVNSSI
jgi:hypothetical protein